MELVKNNPVKAAAQVRRSRGKPDNRTRAGALSKVADRFLALGEFTPKKLDGETMSGGILAVLSGFADAMTKAGLRDEDVIARMEFLAKTATSEDCRRGLGFATALAKRLDSLVIATNAACRGKRGEKGKVAIPWICTLKTSTPFQFGYDGHFATREMCARLGIVRHVENLSTTFVSLLSQSFARLENGSYVWNYRLPMLLCDLNLKASQRLAEEAARISHGDVAVVTPALTEDSRKALANPGYILVEDTIGTLRFLMGKYGGVVLFERRLAGWTVTFVSLDSRVGKGEMQSRSLPVFLKLMRRAAEAASKKDPE